MIGPETTSRSMPGSRLVEGGLALLLLGLLLLWLVPAMLDHTPDDMRLAYVAGAEAWESGHPERVETWMSTSFLALCMALTTRVTSLTGSVIALNVLNLGLFLGTVALVWRELRPRLSRFVWWATLAFALLYAPVISIFRWKQLNLIAFALALAGFWLIRRGRPWSGALSAALSIAIKPIVILLPVALFLRRDTRRAAVACAFGVVLLTMVGQAFLAVRAEDPSVLWPMSTFQTFAERGREWGANPENFAPMGTIRRLTRGEGLYEKAFVGLGVLALALLAHESVRHRPGRAWELFAWACALSPMVGPVGWSHYQILLAPLFLVLCYQLSRRGAGPVWWVPLLFAYLLASLVQRPLGGTLPGSILALLTGQRQSWDDMLRMLALGQFSQYFLVATALAWFNRQAPAVGEGTWGD
jgi:Glycosyltransferase family 87